MKIPRILKEITVASALLAGIAHANAGVVTFSGLQNFQNYSEAGLDMSSDSVWNWPNSQMAHMDNGIAGFVRSNGDTFSLNSVDMVSSGGAGTARFSAYVNGSLLGSIDVGSDAGTFNFGVLFDTIDEFRVTYVNDHFTFDNLNFAEASDVPEPNSLALLGLGAAVLLRRRRKTA
jgi:hypothetical protein